MSSPQLPPPPGAGGSPFGDVLPYLLAVAGSAIVGLLGLCGVLFSQRAPLQAALNGAFSALTKELQDERAQLVARIYELEGKLSAERLTVLQKDGEIRGLKQSRDSLLAWLKRCGVPPPDEGSS
jgi:hypothetical protein